MTNEELDAAVAEKVMGWKRASARTKDGSVEYWLGPNHENQMKPPPYSSNPLFAKMVAKKLEKSSPLVVALGLEPEELCLAALKSVGVSI